MVETRVSLIQRVREKESDAWTEFFDVYRPLLVAYVRKRGVSEHDAADVVQDVFARLATALADFEFDAERGRFRTWLWRVTHNALTDWARRRATRDRAERGWIYEHQSAADSDADGEWNALYRRRILEAAIERVRATSQRVSWDSFEGRILAGRSAVEISAATGVSVNAVYVNASRLLARVREECASFDEPLSTS